MPVRETSLLAYYAEIQPTLGFRQREVLVALLERGEMTNSEIAQALQRPINTITPRTNELAALEYVIPSRKRQCKVTGRTAIAWKINLVKAKIENF